MLHANQLKLKNHSLKVCGTERFEQLSILVAILVSHKSSVIEKSLKVFEIRKISLKKQT